MNHRQPQRRGLGRGLGSLIPTGPSSECERNNHRSVVASAWFRG